MDTPEKRLLGEVRKRLDKGLLEKSGSVLYSPLSTLREGNVYFLGARPAGDPNYLGHKSIERHIQGSLEPDRSSFNEYIGGEWGCAPGDHLIQRNARSLFCHLGLKLEEVCSSNISFIRQAEPGLNRRDARNCWPCHEAILGYVQPKLIIVYHAGARGFLLQKRRARIRREIKACQLSPQRTISWVEVEMLGMDIGLVQVVSTPCLSLSWLSQTGAVDALRALGQKIRAYS